MPRFVLLFAICLGCQFAVQDARAQDREGNILENGNTLEAEFSGKSIEELIRAVETGGTVELDAALSELEKRGPEAKSAIPALIEKLGHYHYVTQIKVSDVLFSIGRASIKPLRKALVESTGQKKAVIGGALGRLDALAIADLKILAKDKHPSVRTIAVVNTPPNQKAGFDLLIKLINDKETAVREFAIDRLTLCNKFRQAAIKNLRPLISSKEVGEAVAKTLGEFGMDSQRSIPDLIAARYVFKNDPFISTTWSILDRIGPPHIDDLPKLAEMLSDQDPEVQLFAAGCIKKLGPKAKEAVKYLELAANKTLPRYKKSLAEEAEVDDPFGDGKSTRHMLAMESFASCLFRITGESSRFFDVYSKFALETNTSLTRHYHDSWKELGDEAIPALRKMLVHPNRAIRKTALEGIAHSGPPMAKLKHDVAKFLPNEDQEIHEVARNALMAMKNEASDLTIPILINDLNEERINLEQFADAVIQVGQASMGLQVILEQGMRKKPIECALALAVVTADPVGTARLITEAARQGKISSQRVAIEALSKLKIKHSVSLEFLIEQLDHSNRWARYDAASEIGRFGAQGKPAMEALKARFEDEHLVTRFKMVQAYYLISNDPKPLHRLFKQQFALPQKKRNAFRQYVLGTIAELGPKGIAFQDYIFKEVKNQEKPLLKSVVEACEAVNSNETLELLSELTTSRDWRIYSAAKDALKKLRLRNANN